MDIVIIGSGSAAFACALRAAKDGAKVTLIENNVIGGTCVNVGCVPSKVFVRASHIAYLQHEHPFLGVGHHKLDVNRSKQVVQQQELVDELRENKYKKHLSENPNLQFIQGKAQFKGEQTIEITNDRGKVDILHFDRALIASGASPAIPPIDGLPQTPYWTSTEALVAKELPDHLIVLGGSAIGLELGQAILHEGVKVTVIDIMALLPKEDPLIGETMQTILEKEGMQIITHADIQTVVFENQEFTVQLKDRSISGDKLLVATGRKPNTNDLNLSTIGVETDVRGAVIVDKELRTTNETIYAAGDCTQQPQFVYVAAAAGTRAAVNMLGGHEVLDLSAMPAVVFTDPQVATVGLTEQQAKQSGIEVESRILTLDNVPRALANLDTRGFIKLVADQSTNALLGAQIVATDASEIIQIAALSLRQNLSVSEISQQMFPYLTMAEGIKLCAQTFFQDVNKLSCCAG